MAETDIYKLKIGSETYNLPFLPLSGGKLTGDLTLHQPGNNANSPKLIFQRGELDNSYYDWQLYASNGDLYFGCNNGGSFSDKIRFDYDGNIYSNGTAVSLNGHGTHIPSGGSAGQFVGKNSSGTLTWLNNPNSDYNVNQSSTTTSNFRPVIFGYSNDATATTLESNVTGVVYASNKIYGQPSTGTLYASNLNLTNNISCKKISGTQFYKNITSADSTPVLYIGSANQDACIFRVWSSDATDKTTYKGVYGYSLVYNGTGTGLTNYLTQYCDNQASDTQAIGWQLDQSGKMGICGEVSQSYSLNVNGSTNATTLYENGTRVLTTAGGTVYNSNANTPIYIKSPNTSAWVGFKDKDNNTLGFIGFGGSNSISFCENNGTKTHNIYHDGNISTIKSDLGLGSLAYITSITKKMVTDALGYTPPTSNNNDKVTQTATTSSNTSPRPILIGMSYGSSAPFSPTTTTDTVYATHKVSVYPNTGLIVSEGGFQGPLTGNVTGNCSGSSGSCTGNAASATVVSSWDTASSSDVKRRIWMSYSTNDGKVAYTDKLTFQTSTNTLFVNDKAVSLSGHTHSNYLTAVPANITVTSISATSNGCGAIGASGTRFTYGYFSQQVHAAGGFYESSDERLKDIQAPLTTDLDKLSQLRKVYFKWKEDPKDTHIGVIAQDIKELYPEIVTETDEGNLNVDYSKLSVIALDAVDKLNNKCNNLETELQEVKEKLNKVLNALNL